MDLQSLKTFLMVAKQRSFSAAADHLHLSQPAISKRIKGLEVQLNCKLFDRVGNKVFLTTAGQVLERRSKLILFELENCRQEISNLNTAIMGELAIATSHHVALHRLEAPLKIFRESFPMVDLNFVFIDSEDAYKAVIEGSVDMAIATLSPLPAEKIINQVIWTDKMIMVVGENHPLTVERCLKTSLSRYPAILPSTSTFTRQLIDHGMAQHNITAKNIKEINYLETIKVLVSVGIGWSVLPESMVTKGLRKLDCINLDVTRTLGLIHHKDRSLPNAAKSLIRLLKQRNVTPKRD